MPLYSSLVLSTADRKTFGINPPGYTAIAVNFDGSNDYLTRGADLTGVADGNKFTFVAWIKMGNDDATAFFVQGANAIGGATSEFFIRRESGNKIRILGDNSGSRALDAKTTTATLKVADGWTAVMMSIDLSDSGKRHVYFGDTSQAMDWTTYDNENIDFSGLVADWGIGAKANGGDKLNGDMADLWFDLSYLDLSVEANRRKFVDSAGKPVNLGADGSKPTGAVPIMFFSGATSAWHTNKGDGGGFTESGALTDASSSPSD